MLPFNDVARFRLRAWRPEEDAKGEFAPIDFGNNFYLTECTYHLSF